MSAVESAVFIARGVQTNTSSFLPTLTKTAIVRCIFLPMCGVLVGIQRFTIHKCLWLSFFCWRVAQRFSKEKKSHALLMPLKCNSFFPQWWSVGKADRTAALLVGSNGSEKIKMFQHKNATIFIFNDICISRQWRSVTKVIHSGTQLK